MPCLCNIADGGTGKASKHLQKLCIKSNENTQLPLCFKAKKAEAEDS